MEGSFFDDVKKDLCHSTAVGMLSVMGATAVAATDGSRVGSDFDDLAFSFRFYMPSTGNLTTDYVQAYKYDNTMYAGVRLITNSTNQSIYFRAVTNNVSTNEVPIYSPGTLTLTYQRAPGQDKKGVLNGRITYAAPSSSSYKASGNVSL